MSDLSTPNAPVSAPNVAAGKPIVRYVGGASLIDAMFDQLEYLLAHVSTKCRPGCRDCKRFEQVKHSLLAPFGV